MGLIVRDSPGHTTFANSSPVTSATSGRLLIGTDQQEDFWHELASGDSHIVLEARAGTGKSSSCREGIYRLLERDRSHRPIYVAFNRSIADEFNENLPSGAKAATMHSMGFAALKEAFPSIGEPSRHKMYDIVDTFLPRRDRLSRQIKSATVKLATLCKAHLVDGTNPATLFRLAAQTGIVLQGIQSTVCGLVPKVLQECLRQSSVIDFSDMVWLPVMLELDFPPCDILFVDEAQDLDPCQHALVQRIAGNGRLVIVGDPYQAIYGFRGADVRSISTLTDQLRQMDRGVSELPLTITRRCPHSHVDLAKKIVPDFEAMPDANGGMVDEDLSPESLLQPGILALCRTNAPLVSTAYRLAAANVPVAIQGKDLGDGLIRLIESFQADSVGDLMRKVEIYRASEAQRLSALENTEGEIEALNDRCGCLLAASEGCTMTTEVASKVATLFLDVTPANQGKYVLLSSIHRAKGREARHVAILRPELLPHPMARTPEAQDQERNLAYVASTRSNFRLSFTGPIPTLLKGA